MRTGANPHLAGGVADRQPPGRHPRARNARDAAKLVDMTNDASSSRPDPRRAVGMAGEAAAEAELRRDGLEIIARSFRARCGEIDLIARDGAVVVFVEVKTRTGDGFGRPSDAVTPAKRLRMSRAASVFLARSGWAERPCRFDVVEVVPSGPDWRVTRIADAFRPGD